jgi:hypothetical protein
MPYTCGGNSLVPAGINDDLFMPIITFVFASPGKFAFDELYLLNQQFTECKTCRSSCRFIEWHTALFPLSLNFDPTIHANRFILLAVIVWKSQLSLLK